MIFNDRVKVELGEDPFTQAELKKEPVYPPVHWKEALKIGGDVTRYTVGRLEVAGLLPRFERRLALRNERFVLSEKDGPQGWHFDQAIPYPFQFFSWSGLITFGTGTGETDVLQPFEGVMTPVRPNDVETVLHLLRCGGSSFPGFSSFGTGDLLHSTVPFVHRRGLTLPGVRLAIDAGLMTNEQLKYE